MSEESSIIQRKESAASSISVNSNSQPQPLSPPTQVSSQNNVNLEHLSKDMIKSTGEYISGEIEMCIADYKLLEQMNRAVTEKYKNLTKYSSSISSEMDKLNEAYAALMPMLSQIDQVEKCVSELEESANKLDSYSKRLEAKFKQFTEKHLSK
jgi:biogenesis of lysosome-related organelles complex 1 subunit 2